MQYKFWLPPSDKFIKVEDMIKKNTPDFTFQKGVEYRVILEKSCKVHEKILEPFRGEGICVDYYFGKPKLFTYTPTNGSFWITTDNTGGSYVTIEVV